MRALALAAVVAAACSGRPGPAGAGPSTVFVPERAATAGDRLLARLPAGAQVLVEVDLARLRANPVVGAAVAEVLAAPPAVPDAMPDALGAPLADAGALVLAAYRVGTPDATTITLVAGGTRPEAALDLGGDVWALAPEGEAPALVAVGQGGPSLADDRALLATRAAAMPGAAEGASLRATARLDQAARGALADALGVGAAPALVSVWGDVADDLAIVAQLADAEPAARPAWRPALEQLVKRAAAAAPIRAIGLGPSIAATEVHRLGAGVQVTLVIGPGRLARAVERFRASRGAPSS